MIILDRKIRCYSSTGELGVITGDTSNEIGAFKSKNIMNAECPISLRGGKFDVEHIGAFTYIGENAMLRKVKTIGRYVYIGINAVMGMMTPDYNNAVMSMVFAPYKNAMFSNFSNLHHNSNYLSAIQRKLHDVNPKANEKIEIGNDVYIGDNTTIIPGVKIGNGAYIMPNTYIDKDIIPYSIVGGVPAKTLGMRFDEQYIEKIEAIEWWKYNPKSMKNIDYTQMSIFLKHCEVYKENNNYLNCERFSFNPLDNTIIRLNCDGTSKLLYKGW